MNVELSAREPLERARSARQMVRLERERIAASSVYGFPLDVGPELALLAVVPEWRLDGYAIVRLADITHVRCDDYERFTERVLEGEGDLARLAPPAPAVRVGSWAQAFEDLRQSGRFVKAHEEEYENEPMSIGPIVGVRDHAVLLHYVGATAQWDAEPSEILFDDVTRVEFDDHYTTVFSRYAEVPPRSV